MAKAKKQIAAEEPVNPLALIFLPLMKRGQDNKAQIQEIMQYSLQSKIAILSKLLTRKFKVIPRRYREAIEKLDDARAEYSLDDVF